jgi:YHS domain-containing protein
MITSIDPVNGREVNAGSKFKSTFNGINYYFCSEESKKEFDKDPVHYVSRLEASSGGYATRRGRFIEEELKKCGKG